MLRLFTNYFQPVMKLVEKTRIGSKVRKTYDKAKTPYQRVRDSDAVPKATKKKLERIYETLNPVKLGREISRDYRTVLIPLLNPRSRYNRRPIWSTFLHEATKTVRVHSYVRQQGPLECLSWPWATKRVRMRPTVRKSRQRKAIRVAALQPAIVEETGALRMDRVERLLAEVEKADLVVLPELWRVGYSDFASYSKKAETIDGDTVSFLSGAARQLGAHLLGGSIVERRGEILHNTAVLFDPAGDQIGVYRKIHLLSYHSQERNLLTAGRQTTVVESEIGRLGLAICYDLRFPELFREMSTEGVEVFVIPAAWPAARAEAWESLCQARAVENQAFVIACNATGRGLLGRSMVVDPWGVKTAALGAEEGILRANVDLEALREFREEFPAWRER